MKIRNTKTPVEVETEMQKIRETEELCGKVEERIISDLVSNAKVTGKIGDKTLLVINPLYIHIPFWQRNLSYLNAKAIGENYNSSKWEVPKVYVDNGILKCADGMHRIYGAFLAKIPTVVVEVIQETETEAIELFLNQTTDRRKMSPADILKAAITLGVPEWVKFQQICHENSVNIKGDCENIEDAVGTFTPIYDGVGLAKSHPDTLDSILKLLKALQWGENSYNAKVIRSMKQLFAYYGRKKAIKYILCKCKGREYFQNNVSSLHQYAMFDYLSKVIETTKPWQVAQFTKENKKDLIEALREAVAN